MSVKPSRATDAGKRDDGGESRGLDGGWAGMGDVRVVIWWCWVMWKRRK